MTLKFDSIAEKKILTCYQIVIFRFFNIYLNLILLLFLFNVLWFFKSQFKLMKVKVVVFLNVCSIYFLWNILVSVILFDIFISCLFCYLLLTCILLNSGFVLLLFFILVFCVDYLKRGALMLCVYKDANYSPFALWLFPIWWYPPRAFPFLYHFSYFTWLWSKF